MLTSASPLSATEEHHEEVGESDPRCGQSLVMMLVRKDRILSHAIQEALIDFHPDEFIRTFEAIHIEHVQQSPIPLNRAITGPLESRPEFHLGWLLKPEFKTELKVFIYHIANTQQYPILTPREWVQSWEDAFEKAGGTISPQWKQKLRGNPSPREKFILRLTLEVAFAFQQEQDFGNPQPMRWTSSRDEDSPFLVHLMRDPILGDLKNFQQLYDSFHRRKMGSRAPHTAYPGQPFYQNMVQRMKVLGIPTKAHRNWKPSRKHWDRILSTQNLATQFAGEIDAFNHQSLPLVGVFLHNTPGETYQDDMQLCSYFSFYDEIGPPLSEFMAMVREESKRKEDLVLGPGASNWAQEFLIQAGVYHSLTQPLEFQDRNPNQANFIHTSSRIWRESRFDLARFKSAVMARKALLGL